MRPPAAILIMASAIAAVSLAACESTQTTSDRLSTNAKKLLNAEGLKVTERNKAIKVAGTSVLKDENGIAVVVDMKNSGKAQGGVPVAIAVKGAGGKEIWSNSTPGLDRSLITAAVVDRGSSFWVNNQIQAVGKPKKAVAKIGPSDTGVPADPPVIKLSKFQFKSDISGVYLAGVVKNTSKLPQKRLVISCVSRSGSTVVAAGRAIIDRLAPDPTPKPVLFRVYFIGNPKGGKVQCISPPTTLTGEAQ